MEVESGVFSCLMGKLNHNKWINNILIMNFQTPNFLL